LSIGCDNIEGNMELEEEMDEIDEMGLILKTITERKPLKEVIEGTGDIDLNNEGKSSAEIPLHLAVLTWNKEVVEELLDFGVDINVKNSQNQTPLILLANMSERDFNEEGYGIIELLLKRGAKVPDDILIIPLQYHRKVAHLLVHTFKVMEGIGKIDLNNEGKTSEEIPLHLAVMTKNKEITEELLELGVDINVKNSENQTALYLLTMWRSNIDEEEYGIIELLLKRGAEVPDDIFVNALKHCKKVARLLVNHRFDIPENAFLIFCYNIALDDDMESENDGMFMMTYYLSHKDFVFENISLYSRQSREIRYVIQKYIEMEQWENAMKIIVQLDGVIGHFDTQRENDGEASENDVIDQENVLSKTFDNMTDFSFVDSKQNKLIDRIFHSYLSEICRFKASMGKKLLELGADKCTLYEEFYRCSDTCNGYFNEPKSGTYKMALEKMFHLGIDLDYEYTSEDGEKIEETKTTNIKDKIYEASVKFGIPSLLKVVVDTDVDLLLHLESPKEMSVIEKCTKPVMLHVKYLRPQYPHVIDAEYDECLGILLKESLKKKSLSELKIVTQFGRVEEDIEEKLNKKGIELEIKSRPLLDYIQENNKLHVLTNIGYLPTPPQSIEVTHSGTSCSLHWEGREQLEHPITGYQVQMATSSRVSDQVAQLREVFKENPPLCYGWDHDPGVQENVDYALAKLLNADRKMRPWIKTQIAHHFIKSTECDYFYYGEDLMQFPQLEWKIGRIFGVDKKEEWETVFNLYDGNQDHVTVSPLNHGSRVKFQVFARNRNGLSASAVQSIFETVAVKPEKPVCPDIKIVDGNGFITWSDNQAKEAGVNMYRVEGYMENGEWKVFGEVGANFEKKFEIPDIKNLGLKAVRIVCMNDKYESDPGAELILTEFLKD